MTLRDHTQSVGTNLEILAVNFVVGMIYTFGMTVNRRDRPMVEETVALVKIKVHPLVVYILVDCGRVL